MIFLKIHKISRKYENYVKNSIFLEKLWNFKKKSTFSPDGEKSSISYGLLVFWGPKSWKSLISHISSNFQENHTFRTFSEKAHFSAYQYFLIPTSTFPPKSSGNS